MNTFSERNERGFLITRKNESLYDQKMPQSQTEDQPTALSKRHGTEAATTQFKISNQLSLLQQDD